MTKLLNINVPGGAYPLHDIHKFAEFPHNFRIHQQFGWICSRGYGIIKVLSRGCQISPKFSAPPSGETLHWTPKSLPGA